MTPVRFNFQVRLKYVLLNRMNAISQLEALKRFTTVVADTGDFESMATYTPEDATTNPSLIYKAVQKEPYKSLLEKAARGGKKVGGSREKQTRAILLELLIAFGEAIAEIVPGRVSVEVDARLSFDSEKSVEMARELIDGFEKRGISRERILIKLATTFEGVQAAKILHQANIHCNMTLLFSQAQAILAAQGGVKLISPFVGRILDWHRAHENRDYSSAEDPGVESVKEIYNYYKKFGYDTEIMAASFRNKGEILELVGCDLLTISPALLEELKQSTESLTRKLSEDTAETTQLEKISLDEKSFRWQLNEDAMATEKLAEGIRKFAQDTRKLEDCFTALL